MWLLWRRGVSDGGFFFGTENSHMIKEGLRSCCGCIATLVGLRVSVNEFTNQLHSRCLSVLEWVVRRGRVYQRSELFSLAAHSCRDSLGIHPTLLAAWLELVGKK